MSGARKDGGPAFPTHEHPESSFGKEMFGMTLRDWFAGQALAMTIPSYVNLPDSADLLAKRSYMVADAMLAERSKP